MAPFPRGGNPRPEWSNLTPPSDLCGATAALSAAKMSHLSGATGHFGALAKWGERADARRVYYY